MHSQIVIDFTARCYFNIFNAVMRVSCAAGTSQSSQDNTIQRSGAIQSTPITEFADSISSSSIATGT